MTELKAEVGKSPLRMEHLKAFLVANSVEKASDLSKAQIETLFKELVVL